MTDFLKFIGDNYERMKHIIETISLPFDYDVFTDTILKCNTKLSGSSSPTNELMTGYFISAYKSNLLREHKYARNQVVEPLSENQDFEDEDYDNSIDLLADRAKNMLEEKYGKELTSLWIQHILGATYEQLDKMTAITNLHYKFRCMRAYIRENLKS